MLTHERGLKLGLLLAGLSISLCFLPHAYITCRKEKFWVEHGVFVCVEVECVCFPGVPFQVRGQLVRLVSPHPPYGIHTQWQAFSRAEPSHQGPCSEFYSDSFTSPG